MFRNEGGQKHLVRNIKVRWRSTKKDSNRVESEKVHI
jgi:hypothetical protein